MRRACCLLGRARWRAPRCSWAYPRDGEQAAVGLIVLEQASQLGEELRPLGAGRKDLPGKAACQHVLCIRVEGQGGEERGQLPECVPCLDRYAVSRTQRAVAPPACRCGDALCLSVFGHRLSCQALESCTAAGSDLRSTAWSLLRAGTPRGICEPQGH